MNNKAIGIFDSGVGGLTCVSYIMEILPEERIIFFGDTARAPYGSRTVKEIRRFSIEIADFLVAHDVKMIVIACNTATVAALDTIKAKFKDIPVIGVIKPTAKAASEQGGRGRSIGLIATNVTVKSKAYEKEIRGFNEKIDIYSKACPLFVPLIEEGVIDNDIMDLTIKYYLDDFISRNKITDLILGCTHYPLIGHRIKGIYPSVGLIDSSKEAALAVKAELEESGLKAKNRSGDNLFFASSLSDKFISMVSTITKGNKEKNKICCHSFETT